MTVSGRNDEVTIVTNATRELAITLLDAPIGLDPERIWRRAQLTRRLEAERRAMAPIDVGSSVAVGMASFAGVVIAAWFWRDLSVVAMLPAGIAALALVATGFVGALTAWRLQSTI
jgi:hypothetical protein